MVTLLAALGGFLTSAFPELLKLLRDKSDKSHEITLLSMQMEMQKSSNINRLEEIGVLSDIRESEAIYRTYYSGIRWVDALNATVRPVVTYAFFGLYASVKGLQYSVISNNTPLYAIVEMLWTVEDQAIFAGIISFYFGQRAMSKLRKH